MIKQILHTFFTRFFTALCNLFIAVIVSNVLGAEGKGEQGLIITTISFIIVITSIVGVGGITFLFPRYRFNVLLAPSYLWLIAIIVMSFFLLQLLAIGLQSYALHICLLSLLLSVSTFNAAILQAQQRIAPINYIQIVQIVLIVCMLCYCFIIEKNSSIQAYLYALYVGYGGSLLLSFIFTFRHYIGYVPEFSVRKNFLGFRMLFRYGFFNQLDIIAQLLSFRLSYYVIYAYIDKSQVGIYSNGVSIIESLWMISRSILMVQHARIVNSRDNQYNARLSLIALRMSNVLMLAGIMPLLLLPSSFFTTIFGNDFGDIPSVLMALAPGVFAFNMSFIFSAYFSGTGKHYVNMVASLSGFIVTLLTVFMLIPHYGIVGAGIAASLSYISTAVIKMVYFHAYNKNLHIRMFPSVSELKTFANEILSMCKNSKNTGSVT